MRGCNLTGCEMTGADLTDADLREVVGFDPEKATQLADALCRDV